VLDEAAAEVFLKNYQNNAISDFVVERRGAGFLMSNNVRSYNLSAEVYLCQVAPTQVYPQIKRMTQNYPQIRMISCR
jgi:hypothetical protein